MNKKQWNKIHKACIKAQSFLENGGRIEYNSYCIDIIEFSDDNHWEFSTIGDREQIIDLIRFDNAYDITHPFVKSVFELKFFKPCKSFFNKSHFKA